jgi:hypothetical protein
MNEGLTVLIGMSIAYLASFLGMLFAYIQYRRRQRESGGQKKEGPDA